MKRILILLALAALMACSAGCAGNDKTGNGSSYDASLASHLQSQLDNAIGEEKAVSALDETNGDTFTVTDTDGSVITHDCYYVIEDKVVVDGDYYYYGDYRYHDDSSLGSKLITNFLMTLDGKTVYTAYYDGTRNEYVKVGELTNRVEWPLPDDETEGADSSAAE